MSNFKPSKQFKEFLEQYLSNQKERCNELIANRKQSNEYLLNELNNFYSSDDEKENKIISEIANDDVENNPDIVLLKEMIKQLETALNNNNLGCIPENYRKHFEYAYTNHIFVQDEIKKGIIINKDNYKKFI